MAERGGFEPIKTVIWCYTLLCIVMRETLEFQLLERVTLGIADLYGIEKNRKRGAKGAHAKRPEELPRVLMRDLKYIEGGENSLP